MKQGGIRQNTHVTGIGGMRSVNKCSFMCITRSKDCVGFNFRGGPPVICELSGIPYDAPSADMVVDSDWDHYAILP